MNIHQTKKILFFIACAVCWVSANAETWRGIEVRSENRCAPYSSEDYRYSQSVEDSVIRQLGGRIYGPYSGNYFASKRDTDIEHIVARSEAHDSGLCATSSNTKRAFANDLLNLTLASPTVNRHQKVDKDPAQWLPELNKCWYVNRVILVRQKYKLSIDQPEAAAIDRVLNNCESLEMLYTRQTTTNSTSRTTSKSSQSTTRSTSAVLAKYDDNGNGRITCSEARKHGIAPVKRGHPAYRYMTDGDGDGVVCE